MKWILVAGFVLAGLLWFSVAWSRIWADWKRWREANPTDWPTIDSELLPLLPKEDEC